jgi:ribosomal protein S21
MREKGHLLVVEQNTNMKAALRRLKAAIMESGRVDGRRRQRAGK